VLHLVGHFGICTRGAIVLSATAFIWQVSLITFMKDMLCCFGIPDIIIKTNTGDLGNTCSWMRVPNRSELG
jgi:hypothetical protein